MNGYDEYHLNHCDALEYLVNNWGEFPRVVPEGGPCETISECYYKNWRFVLTLEGEIVFANCISPGITREEFERYRATVGEWS